MNVDFKCLFIFLSLTQTDHKRNQWTSSTSVIVFLCKPVQMFWVNIQADEVKVVRSELKSPWLHQSVLLNLCCSSTSGDSDVASLQLHGCRTGEERQNQSPGHILPCSWRQQHPAELLWGGHHHAAGPRGQGRVALWREREDQDVSGTSENTLVPVKYSAKQVYLLVSNELLVFLMKANFRMRLLQRPHVSTLWISCMFL